MERLASGRGHCGIKLQLFEYGQNILHPLSCQSAQIPWAQIRRVCDWCEGGSHRCIGCLPRTVKVGGVNMRYRILSQPLSRLLGFPQALFVERYIHPAAQSLGVIQRVKHSFPVTHQDQLSHLLRGSF
jgi:hypothetical protein